MRATTVRMCEIHGALHASNHWRRVDGKRACFNCYRKTRLKRKRCPRCHRRRKLNNYVEGRPVCDACHYQWEKEHAELAFCKPCGAIARIKAKGLCDKHYGKQWRASLKRGCCRLCGKRKAIGPRSGHCRKCPAGRRDRALRELRELFSRKARANPQLRLLFAHLRNQYHDRVLRWRRQLAPEIVKYLRGVARGKVICREALLKLANLAGGAQLLQWCEQAGIVDAPEIKKQRLAQFAGKLADEAGGWAGDALRQFYRFQVTQRIDVRYERKKADPGRRVDPNLLYDRGLLRVVAKFLCYAATRVTSLEDIDQAVVDEWLAQQSRWCAARLHTFLLWLKRGYLTRVPLEAPLPGLSPAEGVPREEFYAVLQRALTDASVRLEVRVALVLLARRRRFCEIVPLPARAVREIGPDEVEVRYPRGLPQRLRGEEAQLLLKLKARSKTWLFPNTRFRGRHISAKQLNHWIRLAGFAHGPRVLHNTAMREALRHGDASEITLALGQRAQAANNWRTRMGLPRDEIAGYFARDLV